MQQFNSWLSVQTGRNNFSYTVTSGVMKMMKGSQVGVRVWELHHSWC